MNSTCHKAAPAVKSWTCPASRLIVSVAAALTVLSACGKSNDQPLPPYVESLLQGATPFQRKLIEDGELSPAEYQQAVFATIQCLDDHGIKHSEPLLIGEGNGMRWKYTIGPYAQADDVRVQADYNQCFDDYERVPLAVWVQQSAPSEAELQTQKQEVVKCTQDHGLGLRSYDEITASLETLSADQHQIVTRCQILIFRGEDQFQP